MTHRSLRRFLAVALLALASAAGCADPSAPTGDVMIRMINASPFAFDEVVVVFPKETESYGNIAVGGESEYRAVSEAYRYAYVRVRSGNKTVVQQPIDFVGESLLTPGRYSYVIELSSLDEPYAALTRLQRD